ISICTNRDIDATMTNSGITQFGINAPLHFLGFFALVSVAARVYRGGDRLFLPGGNLLAALHEIFRPLSQLASLALSEFLAFFGPLAQELPCFLAGLGGKENAHKGANPETYHEVTDFGSGAIAHLTKPPADQLIAQPSTPVSSMQQRPPWAHYAAGSLGPAVETWPP